MEKDYRSIKKGDLVETSQIWNAPLIHNEDLFLVRAEKDCPVPLASIQKDNKSLKYIHIVKKRFRDLIISTHIMINLQVIGNGELQKQYFWRQYYLKGGL